MAGHSKWANIKHRKAGQDAKRGKLFTKLIREITVSAREGGSDETANPRLRAAIDKALDANMTRDAINRAIKRAVGGEEGADLEEVTYEGYAPNGVAVMVNCLTDNRNRTVSEVRHAFTKHGGNLGTDGSVSYLFSKAGQIIIAPGVSEEKVMEVALDNDADDVITSEDGMVEIRTSFEKFSKVKEAIQNSGFKIELSEITMIPATEVELDKDASEKVWKLISHLEDLDDVQSVYSNASFDDSLGE